MTIECVDGQMATPHITGAQKGAMHAGVVGDGCYVLATANKCKATQNSATSVTIGTGDLFIHGRHHQITAAETVTIKSGTQGQKRNDLICAVYHRDAQGIEQPTVTVLKGTPTTGTPADPTVPAGNVLNGDAVDYFPLYRVSLNGTTASAPVQLFKVLPTLASLGDSVSQGGEQPFPGGYLYRFGPLRVLQIQNMTLQPHVPRTVGKLPVKPTREVVGAISYGTSAGYVSVHTDGTVICMAKAGGDFSGQVSFLVG